MLVRTYVTDWSGALWRDSAARKWSRRFLVTGFALPIVAWLGSMSLAYLESVKK